MQYEAQQTLLGQRISHLLNERGTLAGCYKSVWRFPSFEAFAVFLFTFFGALAFV